MRKKRPLPSQERLQELLDYDCDTGALYRKKSLRIARWGGRRAGRTSSNGYRQIFIDGCVYAEHKIIFKLISGGEPDVVDHINNDRSDNRIVNLRPATPKQNSWNRKIRSDNSSGHKGVHFDSEHQKWVAAIGWPPTRLGRFSSLSDAVVARQIAAKNLHGEFYREK